jgi:hypothetical protein
VANCKIHKCNVDYAEIRSEPSVSAGRKDHVHTRIDNFDFVFSSSSMTCRSNKVRLEQGIMGHAGIGERGLGGGTRQNRDFFYGQ